MEQGLTVVILAAGLGTRMKSKKAKVLHRAGGLTLIENVVQSALQVVPKESVFVVTGHQAEEVEQTLAPYGVRHFRQTEQKGTGHALMMGRDELAHLPGRLIVLYGDTPLLSEKTIRAVANRQMELRSAAAVITTVLEDPTGYGRIVLDDAGNILAIVEHKAAEPEKLVIREINSGIYCFENKVLWQHLDRITTNNPAGEYYLTDIIGILREAGHHSVTLRLDDSTELLGINSRVELAVVDRIIREKKTRQLMLDGVTIEKPETVTIDRQVQIGRDTIIEPFVQIRGDSVIGEDCRIGASSIVENSRIGDGVEIHPFSMVGRSVVEAGAHIGPYARLRIDNHVEAGAHIGNFVELKKTRMGAGSKAMHLAYLGDSMIGSGVNIGAGTITCNYDGVKKSPTEIGDGAFVGSNSTLVAPVVIEHGSYIAAGSVITDNVPEGTLAFGRSRQVNKDGYAAKLRKA